MKKALSILLALVMVLTLVACGSGGSSSSSAGNAGTPSSGATSETPSDSGETYNLVVSLTKGQNNTTALQAYLADIEAASNGRITFEIYYSGQLLAVDEIPQGLETGVADITEFVLSQFPSMFPLSSTIPGLPFLGMTTETDAMFGILYNETPEMQKEFEDAGMVLLNYLCMMPYNFHMTGTDPITAPEDLAGLKVITSRADVTNFLQSVGASAVASAPPDYYTNLSNGVVDGTLLHYPMMYNNGLIETVKQHVMFEEGGGMYMDTGVYVISSGAWNKLPADLQALFTDEERVAKFFADNQESMEIDAAKGLAAAEEQGNIIHYLTDDELVAWQEAFAAINAQTLADLDGQGLPATEIYERALEIIAELKG